MYLLHACAGNLAVLGIMMEPGGLIKNPAIQVALESAPDIPMAKRAAAKPLNPLMLLPKKNKDNSRSVRLGCWALGKGYARGVWKVMMHG